MTIVVVVVVVVVMIVVVVVVMVAVRVVMMFLGVRMGVIVGGGVVVRHAAWVRMGVRMHE